MNEAQSARCGVDVVAGIVPGTVMEEWTRRWFISSAEWHAADPAGKTHLLCDLAGRANAYATFLMLQPEHFNWVKTEWVWF